MISGAKVQDMESENEKGEKTNTRMLYGFDQCYRQLVFYLMRMSKRPYTRHLRTVHLRVQNEDIFI